MDLITIGGKIQITTEDGDILEAMVSDKTDYSVDFSIPADDKKFRFFQIGEKVEAMVYHSTKGMYFTGIISERVKAEAPTYTVSNLADFRNVQRRNFVRVHCIEEISYTANEFITNSVSFSKDLKGVGEEIAKYMKPGFMVDLSAGGMKITCDEDIKEGKKIILEFRMNHSKVQLWGTVMHRDLVVKPTGTKYNYGIRFDHITEKLQETIVNYVFLLMRKSTKR
jgi:c-di-GMP-binding flagellar brake protein YcgR